MRFLSLAALLIGANLLAAGNPFLGTWKLNTQKSSSTGMTLPRSMTVKFEPDGDKVRRIVNGVDGDGKPIMQEGTSIPWDGRDHAVPAPGGNSMTVAVKRVSDHRNEVTIKQNGKVIATVESVVSQNGRTLTNTVDGVDEKGRKIHLLEVLEKQ